VKKLLFVLLIAMAFALVSCGEKAETVTAEADKDTDLAQAEDVQVTQCDGNVCTHVAGSTRECAVEGKCPYMEQAKIAKAGVGCPHAAECAEAGKCLGKCGGSCTGACKYCKDKHVCTDACPEDCPKAHVCSGDCGESCPHAAAAGDGCPISAKATKASGCGGCPSKGSCKSGT
jgi:hypothetical protein